MECDNMKKIIFSLIIILSFFFITPVFAEEENRLLFTLEETEEGEERIVYDDFTVNKANVGEELYVSAAINPSGNGSVWSSCDRSCQWMWPHPHREWCAHRLSPQNSQATSSTSGA